MLENRTRLLLILSQELLDQARVIAGRATTVLKLPVSLQIVLRAVIWVGLKRESHREVFGNIESQARAVRQKRSRGRQVKAGSKEAAMVKRIGLAALVTAAAMTLGCARGPVSPIETPTYAAKPVSTPVGIISSEVTVL